MGEAKRKQRTRKQVLSENPFCIYCRKPATTTDHCPPRSFFFERRWPDTYEFSCCKDCNDVSRFDEQALAFLVRIRFSDAQRTAYGDEIKKLADALRNNQSSLIKEWMSEPSTPLSTGSQFIYPRGWKTIHLGSLTHAMLDRFLVKLGKALYFQHNNQIFDGIIYTHVIDMLSPNSSLEYFTTILKIAPLMPTLERNKQKLHDQFSYRFNHSAEHKALYAVVQFSEQLVFQLLAISPEMEAALLRNDPNIQDIMGNRHDCGELG